MAKVTYKDVFFVDPGEQVTEAKGINWRPCPAVRSIRQILFRNSYFKPTNVQGQGPVVRQSKDGQFWHEFNRHHAGLACDIILSPSTELNLGKQLILLFLRHQPTMKWLSIDYQDISLSPTAVGGQVEGHLDHIHIDWLKGRPEWKEGISEVPILRTTGKVENIKVTQGNKIASAFSWDGEAMTDFGSYTGLDNDLNTLITQQQSKTVPDIGNLKQAANDFFSNPPQP